LLGNPTRHRPPLALVRHFVQAIQQYQAPMGAELGIKKPWLNNAASAITQLRHVVGQ
jgi:hypothetical protein